MIISDFHACLFDYGTDFMNDYLLTFELVAKYNNPWNSDYLLAESAPIIVEVEVLRIDVPWNG